ncbi:uncharacterized protein LOC121809216 [Salvia splendens]|uniref:uncharacterized protein LOC121809216 n=1 Tax=Salvia splendens TaxID=180675 RepID=UPI001C27A2FA|nr:uncharacterized protein LOC121809216 [Salvia splendens]
MDDPDDKHRFDPKRHVQNLRGVYPLLSLYSTHHSSPNVLTQNLATCFVSPILNPFQNPNRPLYPLRLQPDFLELQLVSALVTNNPSGFVQDSSAVKEEGYVCLVSCADFKMSKRGRPSVSQQSQKEGVKQLRIDIKDAVDDILPVGIAQKFRER